MTTWTVEQLDALPIGTRIKVEIGDRIVNAWRVTGNPDCGWVDDEGSLWIGDEINPARVVSLPIECLIPTLDADDIEQMTANAVQRILKAAS